MIEETSLELQKYKVRSCRPETVDSEAVFQTTEKNPVSSKQRVSGEFVITQSSVIGHFHDFSKNI